MHQFLTILIQAFAVLLIVLSVIILATENPSRMISYYKAQALLLAGITLLSALENFFDWVVAILIFSPLFIFWIIRPLLAQATIKNVETSLWLRLRHSFIHSEAAGDNEEALSRWFKESQNGLSLSGIFLSLLVTGLAYIVSFTLIPQNSLPGTKTAPGMESSVIANSLAVTLTLVMIGLLIMVVKRDIISQIIGLLVMEHGMFLGTIRLLPGSQLQLWLVISLFLYLVLLLVILVVLLPDLHSKSHSLKIEDQTILKADITDEACFGEPAGQTSEEGGSNAG